MPGASNGGDSSDAPSRGRPGPRRRDCRLPLRDRYRGTNHRSHRLRRAVARWLADDPERRYAGSPFESGRTNSDDDRPDTQPRAALNLALARCAASSSRGVRLGCRRRRRSRPPEAAAGRRRRRRRAAAMRPPAAERRCRRRRPRNRSRRRCRSIRCAPKSASTSTTRAARVDLWERVRRGFAMPDLDNDLVRDREHWYATRPDYVARMTERGGRYLFHIVEELDKRGMPTELALLPFIESAYNPQAMSVARGLGHVAVHPVDRPRLRAQAEHLPRRPPRRARLHPRGARLPAEAATACSATGTSRWPPTTGAKAACSARSPRTSAPACRPTTRACACRPRRGATCPSCRR